MKRFEQYITEAGAARVRRMFWGDVPTVQSVGIITAQNPNGQPPSDDQHEAQRINKELNRKLFAELKAGNYGPIKMKGKYASLWEDSFLVPNISKEDLIDLGQRYGQEAVIWGSRAKDNDPNSVHFIFEWIEGGQTTQTRSIHVGNEDVQKRDNFFSMLKGRKFVIPFFDDPYSQHQQVAGKPGQIQPPQSTNIQLPQPQQYRKAESLGPEFELIVEGPEISYDSKSLPKNFNVKQVLDKIRQAELALTVEGKTAKYYWMHRGHLREAMQQLAELV